MVIVGCELDHWISSRPQTNVDQQYLYSAQRWVLRWRVRAADGNVPVRFDREPSFFVGLSDGLSCLYDGVGGQKSCHYLGDPRETLLPALFQNPVDPAHGCSPSPRLRLAHGQRQRGRGLASSMRRCPWASLPARASVCIGHIGQERCNSPFTTLSTCLWSVPPGEFESPSQP